MPPERRSHERREAAERGLLVHSVSGETFPCSIIGRSPAGARLQLSSADVPEEGLTLIDRHMGSSHELRLVWREGALIGVAYVTGAGGL